MAVSGAEENVMRPAAASPATRWVKVEALNFVALLPPVPAAGSVAARADLDAVLQVQAWRTPEQIAWAKVVESDEVFNHAAVLGPWFTAARLPQTAAFFKALSDDLGAIDAASKKPFLRARPATVDARVEPCVRLPKSTSYPSGTALQAQVWAELLAEILPAKREALIARSHRAGWGRVIGGVHFPSDLEAGRQLAGPFLAECRKSPEFKAAFEACRRELTAAAAANAR